VAYEDHGRSGFVIFYRDDLMLRFPYEFGGGQVIAIIDIPTPGDWNKSTGLSAEERMPVLEFIAQRVIRDQANGYSFIINDTSLTITV
jgi:hypothetical protein